MEAIEIGGIVGRSRDDASRHLADWLRMHRSELLEWLAETLEPGEWRFECREAAELDDSRGSHRQKLFSVMIVYERAEAATLHRLRWRRR